MEAPEQLQLIMEPFSKVYFDPSLYPSMVIAYNYCFSTVLGKVCELERMAREKDTSIKLGAIKYTVSVLGARIMVKASVKHARGKRLRRILEARQLALKLVANVTYGYTSANFSGRMPCVEVADAILGKGRETLERAITRVNEGNYGGAKVIYGDTDSMFVLVPGATKSEAFAIGRRIADDVTKDNPTPVVLKLEKVYMGCVLETKKRYAGWMYENEDDKEGVLDSKGLETIRRDTCPVVAKILEKSLHLIFTRNWRGLSVYLNTKLSRLRDLPYTDFVFSKEFRGEYTDNAPVPQLKVAL
ncbi:DNA polymerase family B [Necator americanus]|uniref:DNA-directed DNA polymerase n=1 Tax=Necator americanus TaxID=51031 RepID=W2SX93_NECAM|nr:DNA polymerase family B [Necator americanus]ETN74369.1 DNA polymerase family B [Necator americanus]